MWTSGVNTVSADVWTDPNVMVTTQSMLPSASLRSSDHTPTS